MTPLNVPPDQKLGPYGIVPRDDPSSEFLALERGVRAELDDDYPATMIAESAAGLLGLPVEWKGGELRVYVSGNPASGTYLSRRGGDPPSGTTVTRPAPEWQSRERPALPFDGRQLLLILLSLAAIGVTAAQLFVDVPPAAMGVVFAYMTVIFGRYVARAPDSQTKDPPTKPPQRSGAVGIYQSPPTKPPPKPADAAWSVNPNHPHWKGWLNAKQDEMNR